MIPDRNTFEVQVHVNTAGGLVKITFNEGHLYMYCSCMNVNANMKVNSNVEDKHHSTKITTGLNIYGQK